MIYHYVEYEIATGQIIFRVSNYEDALTAIVPQEGHAGLIVPHEALIGNSNDLRLDVMKPFLMTRVDQQAEAFRLMFITPGAGQAMTYTYKADEARAFAIDPTATVPFLNAEATARGIPVEDVAAEVFSQVEQWVAMGSKIEGARMASKSAISAAIDTAGAIFAATVDWSALAA